MPVPITAGNILELKLVGNFNGVLQTNNIFHYVVDSLGSGTGAPATQDEFAMNFIAGPLVSIIGFTSVLQKYTSIQVSELDITHGTLVNGETVPILGGAGDGLVSGEVLPPFVCFTFKYLRPSTTFRHGFKRFAGVPESVNENGVPTTSALGNLAAAAVVLQTMLGANLNVAGVPGALVTGAAAEPAVLKRVFNGDPLDPINVALIDTVIFDKLGSQNSRKFGVGI